MRFCPILELPNRFNNLSWNKRGTSKPFVSLDILVDMESL